MIRKILFYLVLFRMAAISTLGLSQTTEYEKLGKELLSNFYNQTGFVLCLGVSDASLVMSLYDGGKFLVKGIAYDAQALSEIQNTILEKGIYGQVTVDVRPVENRLPLADSIVDVLVIEDVEKLLDSDFAIREALRVLCSYSTICVRVENDLVESRFEKIIKKLTKDETIYGSITKDKVIQNQLGDWVVYRKKKKKSWDSWPYSAHGPDGNAVSEGEAPEKPEALRYYTGRGNQTGAGWGREITSGEGRFYSSYNRGGIEARNVDNGMKLWDVPFGKNSGGVNSIPANDRVYCYRGDELVALRATDGSLATHYYKSEHKPYLVLVDAGVVLGVETGGIHAFDEKTGEKLWQFPKDGSKAGSPLHHVVSSGEQIYIIYGNDRRSNIKSHVLALRIDSGKIVWNLPLDDLEIAIMTKYEVGGSDTRLVYDRKSKLLFVRGSKKIKAVNRSDGSVRYNIELTNDNQKMFAIRPMLHNGYLYLPYRNFLERRDPLTGELIETIRFKATVRCQHPKIVDKKLFVGYSNHVSINNGEVFSNRTGKVQCRSGFHIAHGKKISPPHHCNCYPMLWGYVAMVNVPEHRGSPTTELFSGDKVPINRNPKRTWQASEWPMQDGDLYRSRSSRIDIKGDLSKSWHLPLPARKSNPLSKEWKNNPYARSPYSQVVIAQGVGIFASTDTHQIIAFNPEDGKIVWKFLADNKVDTAPTIYKGSVYFGSRGGSIHSLDLETGSLIWQRRLAPYPGEGIINWASLESPWPVSGSIYIENNIIVAFAGIHPEADGGVFTYGINPDDGNIIWKNRIHNVEVKPVWGEGKLMGREAYMMSPLGLMTKDGDKICMSRYRIERKTGNYINDVYNPFKRVENTLVPIVDNYGVPMLISSKSIRDIQFTFDQRNLFSTDYNGRMVLCVDSKVMAELASHEMEFPASVVKEVDKLGLLPAKFKTSPLKYHTRSDTFSNYIADKAKWKFGGDEKMGMIMGLAKTFSRLYVISKPGNLTVLDSKTGAVIEEIKLGAEPCFNGISIANDSIFISTTSGILKFGSN